MRGKHFITDQEWSKEELELLFETASELKRDFTLGRPHPLLPLKTLFMIFFDNSTRTRNSFEAGITQLGGHAHDLTPDKMQISHGENAKDTAKVLSRYGHGIAIRHCAYGEGNQYIREVAKHATVPVLNMQDDVYHPCQVLADLQTIRERFGKNTKGLKLAMSWTSAPNYVRPISVPQSVILLMLRFGIDVTLAHPKEFHLQPEIIGQAEANAVESGAKFRVTDSMEDAFEGADIVLPKSWGPLVYTQDKQEGINLIKKYPGWRCDSRMMSLAAKQAIYMHPLPADRNFEVTDEVIDGPQSVVYDEAENRLHVQKALMALTMGGRA
ncbi:MAG TPA: ornithine carbamoyltransferase [Symbiobacteriaceae bacterium]|jgi:N-acetylornithine carbamoyltransferase